MINFSKYHGTGNDFVVIDNREQQIQLSENQVKVLCDRRFGVGADGLILLQDHADLDFEMIYYNSDGKLSSMCGNGGRCISAFAASLGLGEEKGKLSFMAVDGEHYANLVDKISTGYVVELGMKNVDSVESVSGHSYVLDTGSPHWVGFVEDLDVIDLVINARKIRYSDPFTDDGINVNFIQQVKGGIRVRTYERGVEDETFSCGTGVVACAISWYLANFEIPAKIFTKGGELKVQFDYENNKFTNIRLIGPAQRVYTGMVDPQLLSK